MKLLIRIGLFLALVGGLAFVKIKYFPSDAGIQSPGAGGGGAKGNAPPTGVMGYIVKSENLDNSIFATGTVIASEMVDLKPEVAGKIVQLNITEGKPVTKGQLLIKLNDVDLQASLKKLQAQLNLAEQSEHRLRKLLEVKGISQDEYDAVTNQINNIKADMEFTQAQIAKTELRAPFNGIIGLKSVSLGSYINATSQVATILVLNPVKIDFTIPEKYANTVRVGDNITFSIEGEKDKFTGKVYATENQIDPVTRTFKIRATASNSGSKLKAGAFVKVDFSLKEINNALMVPTEAIIPILKGQQVFVCKNGTAKAIQVEVGVRNDIKIQVTSGVSVGDTIITSGLMGLKDGVKVKFTTVQ
ncbi:MAG: efflux RND transporter periplasmic adaptor subunit [Saprospiraceae bacterium]|nr:efflux RND transporter periplasmic adaptor subunit [Saprospiraceae bacterium]